MSTQSIINLLGSMNSPEYVFYTLQDIFYPNSHIMQLHIWGLKKLKTWEWSDTLDDHNANLIYLIKHLDFKEVS